MIFDGQNDWIWRSSKSVLFDCFNNIKKPDFARHCVTMRNKRHRIRTVPAV